MISMTLEPSSKSEDAHEIIVQLRQEAESLDKTIHTLKSQLVELEARREAIGDKLSGVVYPVNSLPPEVLGRIFVAAASLTQPKKVNSLLLRIILVCRHWHNVAIANPALWTRLCYVPGKHGGEDRLFSRFLQRSRGLPISFTLDERSKSILDWRPNFFESCSRWKDAKIAFPITSPLDFDVLGDSAVLALPHLEEVTLSLWVPESRTMNRYQTFSNAPQLRTVSVNFSHLLTRLAFPLHQVRKLTILHHSLRQDIRVLLLQLTALEDLSLGSIPPSDTHHDSDDVDDRLQVDLPFLTTLSLLGEGSSVILPHVHVPRLSKLHLSDFNNFDKAVFTRPAPGILHSLTNLVSITIVLKNERDRSLAALLLSPDANRLPLHHLTVTVVPMSEETQNNIVAAFSSPEFLPELQSLTLIVAPAISGSIRPFVVGVNARLANAVSRGEQHKIKLKKLIVEWQRSPDGMSDEELQELRTLQQTLEQVK